MKLHQQQRQSARRSRSRFSSSTKLCSSVLLLLSVANLSHHSACSAFAVPDPVLHFGIGAVAGGVGAVAAYPCDCITSQLQTKYGKARYRNGWHALCETLQDNPLRLYKGVGVQVLGIAPEKGIKLGVNDILKTTSQFYLDGTFPLWAQVLSGGLSGFCQVIASSPLEVLKVGLQTSNMTVAEVWHQVGGVHGLFRGAEACIVRDVIFTAICFPLYAHWVAQGMPTFVAGACAGVISSFAATPPDVIKTRILSQDEWSLQKQKARLLPPPLAVATTANYELAVPPKSSLFGSNSTSLDDLSYPAPVLEAYSDQDFVNHGPPAAAARPSRPNPLHVFQEIMEKEGPSVLFSGVSERCIGAIPRFGTTLAMHDLLEQMAQQAGWLSHAI